MLHPTRASSVGLTVGKLSNECVTELGPWEPPKAPVSGFLPTQCVCLGDCKGPGCRLLKPSKMLSESLRPARQGCQGRAGYECQAAGAPGPISLHINTPRHSHVGTRRPM